MSDAWLGKGRGWEASVFHAKSLGSVYGPRLLPYTRHLSRAKAGARELIEAFCIDQLSSSKPPS
jgi:hypothetical protein